MKKFSFFVVIVILFVFLSTFEKTFSQTIKLVAENLNLAPKKEYVVDSVSLFAFVKRKENEAKIEAFFKKNRMPLHEKAETFVKVAEKYDLPTFLLPTISIKESSGGKKNFRPFNCFGFGKKSFQSYEEAIEYVANQLTNGKYYKGKTLEEKLYVFNSVRNKKTEKNPKGWYTEDTFKYMKEFEKQKIDTINYLNYIDSFKVEKVRESEILKGSGSL